MTVWEALLCVLAVCSSSFAQMGIKYAAGQDSRVRILIFLGLSGGMMMLSVFVAVWVLRTIQLSQLIPFSALAYVLVPILGSRFFGEKLDSRFWVGVGLIILGIIIATPQGMA